MEVGLGIWPAFSMNTSHVPTSAAISCIALSSATSARKFRQVVLLLLAFRDSFVWASVESLRPMRTRRLAPAAAKAIAVSRPTPLPLKYGLSDLFNSPRCRSEAYGTGDNYGLASAAKFSALGRDGAVSVIMPGRHWRRKWWLHDCYRFTKACVKVMEKSKVVDQDYYL